MIKISATLMIKDEEKRLPVTLNSLIDKTNKPFIHSLIVYDTGSTDNTLNILKDWTQKFNIPLFLKLGEFEAYDTSRNKLLDFADTLDTNVLLLLDSNDELKNAEFLQDIVKLFIESTELAFMIPYSLEYPNDRIEKFYAFKLLKNKCGLRYSGSIHEQLDYVNSKYIRVESGFYIYQNREEDNKKTSKRWLKDAELLLKDISKNPENSRAIYYLAQTYACIAAYSDDSAQRDLYVEKSMDYYKKRTEMGGYNEEIFSSFMKLGQCSNLIKKPLSETINWFTQAFIILPRAEPLVIMSELYLHISPQLSYLYAVRACEMGYPTDAYLFINESIYNYYRYHMLSVSGFNLSSKTNEIGPFMNGIKACSKIINTKWASDIDKKAWLLYSDLFSKLKNNMTHEQIIIVKDLLNE